MSYKYVDVILPLPLYSPFTYSIPEDMLDGSVKIGSRVLVQFGRKKFYTAIVIMLHDNAPQGYEVKDIVSILDEYPIIKYPQLKLWEWISQYYLCSLGEVYKAALPAGLKVESETYIMANPEFEFVAGSDELLSEREMIVLSLVRSQARVQIMEIERATGLKRVEATVSSLIEKDALYVSERIKDNYRPKSETYVILTIEQGDNEGLNNCFSSVKQAKRQETLLLAYLELSQFMRKGELKMVRKSELLSRADVSVAILNAMVTKGLMRLYKQEVNRFAAGALTPMELPKLSEAQEVAYKSICRAFIDRNITLLHGVTSSGKTEIYIHLIEQILRQNKQVLYLVPEIALTTQLTIRLQRVFGDKVLIYHSKFSDNERVDIWKRLLNSNESFLVIGARSAIFLPYTNLGLVIVDEEHESSYKQHDPAPRYNGRNVAMVLASMHGAKTVLGSATPSVESYHNATTGKYGFVELNSRYEDIQMPEIRIVDLKVARKKRELRGIFSKPLLEACQSALADDKQIILFQNRRGYAPMATCKECAWIPKCENCDVSLTYHKYTNTLTCHYCGFSYTLPTICPACKQPTIEVVGYGTERIEDDIEGVFPESKILRMDLDTTRSKTAYDKIIDGFSNKRYQILVGTQMLSKGLDFDGVSLVGVMNSDSMLNFPDFRAHERAFNMLEQVAGRAGRKGAQGLVYIQSSTPAHPLFKYLINHDYKGYFQEEIGERQKFGYPPFRKLIYIYMKHRDNNILSDLAVRYCNMLIQIFGERVLGPEEPIVSRVKLYHIRQIMLKMENEASMIKVKRILRDIYENMLKIDPRMKGVVIYYDVDPM
ncbi:MAG: primosomal protein N' [Bacteroidales bacterium]